MTGQAYRKQSQSSDEEWQSFGDLQNGENIVVVIKCCSGSSVCRCDLILWLQVEDRVFLPMRLGILV